MVSRRLRRRRVALSLQIVAGMMLLGSAGLVAASNDQPSDPAANPAAQTPTQFGAAGGGGAATASPYRLEIPKLGVDAPIVAVDTDADGALGVPTDPAAIGWWADGPAPGSPVGTSILAGHANTAERGPGALLELETLQPGDQLAVSGWSAPVTFVVERIVRYPRTEVPPSAFDQRGPGRLAIVSCDNLDKPTGTYLDNVIVYARVTATSGPPAPDAVDPVRTEPST